MARATTARWAMQNGMWTFGVSSPAEFVRKAKLYTLADIASDIRAATLVLDAENDQFLKGQPQAIRAAPSAQKTLVTPTTAEAAGEHCHMGAMYRAHQIIFDWLDENLARI
jgi:hypothetical protein